MCQMTVAQIRCGNLTELEIATVVNHYLLPLVKVTSCVNKFNDISNAGGRESNTYQVRERCWTGQERRKGEEMINTKPVACDQ